MENRTIRLTGRALQDAKNIAKTVGCASFEICFVLDNGTIWQVVHGKRQRIGRLNDPICPLFPAETATVLADMFGGTFPELGVYVYLTEATAFWEMVSRNLQ